MFNSLRSILTMADLLTITQWVNLNHVNKFLVSVTAVELIPHLWCSLCLLWIPNEIPSWVKIRWGAQEISIWEKSMRRMWDCRKRWQLLTQPEEWLKSPIQVIGADPTIINHNLVILISQKLPRSKSLNLHWLLTVLDYRIVCMFQCFQNAYKYLMVLV